MAKYSGAIVHYTGFSVDRPGFRTLGDAIYRFSGFNPALDWMHFIPGRLRPGDSFSKNFY
jgi:hypothetical protein